MFKGESPIQRNYPIPEDFVSLAKKWCADAIDIMLGVVWQGFDALSNEFFDISRDDENIEDEITYTVFCKIQDVSGFSPFQIILHPPEREQRSIKGSMPESDLGFRLRGGNIRSHFSIEAKVIRTDGDISKYVNEIKNNFMTRRYSAFSTEAAMLGYLLSGSPFNTFNAIAKSLECTLDTYDVFNSRNHRISDHIRQIPQGIKLSNKFRCHHMIINFSNN